MEPGSYQQLSIKVSSLIDFNVPIFQLIPRGNRRHWLIRERGRKNMCMLLIEIGTFH